MKRRTLLQNLFSSVVAAPMLSAFSYAPIRRVIYGSLIPFLKSLDWWAIDITSAFTLTDFLI